MRSDGAAFVDVAARIARRIAGSAVWSEGRCNWVGAPSSEQSRMSGRSAVAALGPDLYEGTSGVALFLAEAAARLDERRLCATALAAMRLAIEQAGRIGIDGLFAGRPGVAYAAARTAALHGDEDLATRAAALLRTRYRDAGRPGSDDVVGGRAGSLLAMLALPAREEDLATRLGDELIARAQRGAAGWSWRDRQQPSMHDLCGYAHGASGIGHALAELYGVTEDDRHREAAERAFAYERSWYDARTGTWPDLRGIGRRTGRQAPVVPSADSWCNGSAGIALARLRAHELLGIPALRRDAEIALGACERHVAGQLARDLEDFSLCHGLAGVCDALLEGGREDLACRVGRLGVERYARPGAALRFPCGVPAGETPALMQGLAGIGLFYLRLADSSVTSPLLTAPSKGCESRMTRRRRQA
jgi:lantibiotic biosynthesis protein